MVVCKARPAQMALTVQMAHKDRPVRMALTVRKGHQVRMALTERMARQELQELQDSVRMKSHSLRESSVQKVNGWPRS